LYDIIPLTHPQFFEPEVAKAFRESIEKFLVKCDLILCISKTVKDQVLSRFHNDNLIPKLDHFVLGCDFKPESKFDEKTKIHNIRDILQPALTSQFWLMVGTLEPRKNHALVIKAFEEKWAQGDQESLVILGRSGWRCDHLIQSIYLHPQYNKKLFYFADTSDTELSLFYEKTVGLVLSSFGEGFGLPLAEAMNYGKRVVCSDIPVFREIGRDYPEYFNPLDPKDCILAMRNACAREFTNRNWISWKETAKSVLEKIEKIPAKDF
jgi:alpha-1,2-rhamnosyltransferase